MEIKKTQFHVLLIQSKHWIKIKILVLKRIISHVTLPNEVKPTSSSIL